MLIIDKKGRKDYYDYLVGIYGIDRNLVLDRRDFQNYIPMDSEKVTVILCGWIYEGYYDKVTNKTYYGEDLLRFGSERKLYSFEPIKRRMVYIKSDRRIIGDESYVTLEPYPDIKNQNEKEDCPILIAGRYRSYFHYPQLSWINFGSCVDAEAIFKMLTSYLSEQKTKAEQHQDTRTDVEKLLSKGFDKKSSFRKL